MSVRPTVRYWHLWTDDSGISRQTHCALTEFDLKSIAPPADPQWQGKRSSGRTTTLVTVLPVGWIGKWHENPKPQWIIPLSGRWFVESMDGKRVEMGPGELSFGGDQNCRLVEDTRGHRSGTVGDTPAMLMIVQLEDAPAPFLPCQFR
ncbi:cupin [Mesorhizobium sp. SARCC-RB16n]|uniref:cupin domain-containing protein n=1 Tax=Mesorhizobium sp. SARCC-RB16n TaxID=2116687 RepID=UPI00122F7857|nr:cupin domain-containing protein [Mesorhizobium sp. SARCC-RB16n]KAA3442064.1 cupin [Mesorhizobium sp. SARCC-RB16n]